MELDWKIILILVQWLIIVIMAFALFRATPPKVVDLIFGLLEQQAQKTKEVEDDQAVQVAKEIYGGLKKLNEPVSEVTASTVTIKPANTESIPA